MDPLTFKSRFTAALGEIPDWVDLDPRAFVVFDRHALLQAPLRATDVTLLSEIGMPGSAAPFLSFHAWTADEIADIRETFGIPGDSFPIGHTGTGDHICVSGASGEVVYFEHDVSPSPSVFINSSLLLFAESLCVFQELFVSRRHGEAPAALQRLDPPAMLPGTMWHADSK